MYVDIDTDIYIKTHKRGYIIRRIDPCNRYTERLNNEVSRDREIDLDLDKSEANTFKHLFVHLCVSLGWTQRGRNARSQERHT